MRDAQKTLPVALFSPRNIVRDSFAIEYLMTGEETADSVTVAFFNEKTWKPDEVTAHLPDSASTQPATLTLFGCTNRAQALREALYSAAANRYRRRIVRFRTELEGLIPTYGDLIAISHDMPSWGQAGDVISYTPPYLELSEPVHFAENHPHYIALRKRDGSLSGPWPVTLSKSPTQLCLDTGIDFTPYTDAREERTHFVFGAAESWATQARVISVKPAGDLVEITAVAEDTRVHRADQSVDE